MNYRWIIAMIAAIGMAAPVQAAPGGLQFSLDARQGAFSAGEHVIVHLTVANPGKDAASLAAWQAPDLELDDALFAVTLNGKPVTYVGPIVKRSPAEKGEQVVIPGGAKLARRIDLSDAYDFSASGDYVVQYLSAGAGEAYASNPVTVYVAGRSTAEKPIERSASLVTGITASTVSFSGKCTATQQTTIVNAVSQALDYSSGADTYLSTTPRATSRYTTWFGALSTTNWGIASTHFTAIKDAFANKPITVDCGCKKNYYAYVYANKPYVIYVCRAFWTAPMTGTDSKAGTLIHEMSHFTVVASTNDYAYGQTAAKNLAISDPSKAVRNADSHEYFAENTPFLP